MLLFRRIAALLIVAIFPSVKAKEEVSIGLQPAFHAIPIYAAIQMGWFEELGIKINLLPLYASGLPQVEAAVENKSWDFGIAGAVPNVIAAGQGISTIGISNDEGRTTEVYGAPGVTEWPPLDTENITFVATKSSTGELLLRKCLEKWDINVTDSLIEYASQDDIMSGLAAGDFTYGSLWAPNTYTYQEQHQVNVNSFCNGRDVQYPILGGLMARNEWAEANPAILAKVLTGYLRGVTFMRDPNEFDSVIGIAKDFYNYANIAISDEAIKNDLTRRDLYNLDGQLILMERGSDGSGVSDSDRYYSEMGQFLVDQGVIESKPEPVDYITDKYMQMVYDDIDLRDFADYDPDEKYADDSDGCPPKMLTNVSLLFLVFLTTILGVIM